MYITVRVREREREEIPFIVAVDWRHFPLTPHDTDQKFLSFSEAAALAATAALAALAATAALAALAATVAASR